MTNLLRANFSRLKRDGMFWSCVFTVLACSTGFMVLWCLENAERGALTDLDEFYFRLSAAMGFFYAMFTCLFLSVEYGEGTIRNKLAVGHTRWEVYLSHFITVFAASLCIAAAWLAGGLAGAPFLGFLTIGPAGTALCFIIIVGFTAAFSAIYTFIGMLNDRRSATVITIAVWLILVLVSSFFENALHEPEFSNPIMVFQDGVQMVGEQTPNPYYISGIRREIYEFVVDFLPTGQSSSLQNINIDHPLRMLLSSLGITAAFTLGGLRLFERKDLK